MPRFAAFAVLAALIVAFVIWRVSAGDGGDNPGDWARTPGAVETVTAPLNESLECLSGARKPETCPPGTAP